jgi:hypothetical protein
MQQSLMSFLMRRIIKTKRPKLTTKSSKERIMRKNQNLKIILAIEITLVLCIGIGIVGIIIYAVGGSQVAPASGQPPIEPPTAITVPTTLPVDFPTDVPADAPATIETPMDATLPEVKGMALEKQPDKTMKFIDYDGGYEVTFPAGWLVVRPGDEEEFNAVLTNEGKKNIILAEQMNLDKSHYDAEFHRVYSYPLRPDIEKNTILGFSKLAFDPANDVPINNNTMGSWIHDVETSNAIPGFNITSANIVENASGISVMVVKGRFTRKNNNGDMVPFSVTVLFFKPTSGSIVRLAFTILQDYQKQITPDLDAIRESITLSDE